jgi:hypothetical protein
VTVNDEFYNMCLSRNRALVILLYQASSLGLAEQGDFILFARICYVGFLKLCKMLSFVMKRNLAFGRGSDSPDVFFHFGVRSQ